MMGQPKSVKLNHAADVDSQVNLQNLRKQAEQMLSKSNTDIAQMSTSDIQKLIVELQTHQIELQLQNEELNKANQDLIESRKHYNVLYNAGTVGYLSLTVEGVILQANRVAANLLNCPVDRLIDKKLGEFIYPDDQDGYYFFLQSFNQHENNTVLTIRLNLPREIPMPLRCPGTRVTECSETNCSEVSRIYPYVEFRHEINYQSTPQIIFISLKDISEQQIAQLNITCLNEKLEEKILIQTEQLHEKNLNLQRSITELHLSKQQLIEREAKFNAIFNAAIEGIITVRKSGIIVSVNSAIETIFGYKQDELIGTDIKKLIRVGKGKKQDAFLTFYGSRGMNLIRTVHGVRKDRSTVPLDISIAKFDLDGVEYFTLIARDVSLRIQREREEKAHLDELAHVTRLGLMGEMTAGIAHQVNQPLTAVTCYVQACLSYLDAEQPDLEQLRNILTKTYQQALKAGDIIHHMREFVTFKTLHRSSVNINDLIAVCVSLCESEFNQNKIVRQLDLAKNLPLLHVDSVQIEQVLLNLIRNSFDALKHKTQTKQRQLSIQSGLDNNHRIIVRIKDNGPGIKPADQSKILTPFFTSKATGMGMGLSICQSIVKAHNGELSFNSQPGKGTTFYFTLPLQE